LLGPGQHAIYIIGRRPKKLVHVSGLDDLFVTLDVE
jgi:hypothetical protein